MNANEHGSSDGDSRGDKYGETDFDVVPRGPFEGRPWVEVPALTLHSLLNAVDFGLIHIDQRRVVAIREGLRKKDEGGKLKAAVGSQEPQMHADGRGLKGGAQG